MLKLLGMPVEASTHAAQIDNMIVLVHWLMAVLFVGWGIYFVYVLFRFRRGANPTASYEGAHGKAAKYVEIAVVIAEAVLLIVYAIPAWANRVADFPPENEAVVVHVTGKQFEWDIRYPGPDGRFGRTDIHLVSADNPLGLDRNDPDAKDDITTINQLHLPVDRPVLVHLTSMNMMPAFVACAIGASLAPKQTGQANAARGRPTRTRAAVSTTRRRSRALIAAPGSCAETRGRMSPGRPPPRGPESRRSDSRCPDRRGTPCPPSRRRKSPAGPRR